jgi:SAM-dependent methyltransferase
MLKYIKSELNNKRVKRLEVKMADFYAKSQTYYNDINFAVNNWSVDSELAYQSIIDLCEKRRVAEIGCGQAGILDVLKDGYCSYTGCDFSKDLTESNHARFPTAKFKVIEDPSRFPLETESCDFIFCVFVLEHVVRPKSFIEELVRCCKRGGRIVIFCPDFGGRLNISSQLTGFSNGSGMEKIRNGRLIDGVYTGFINKLLLPYYLKFKLRGASADPVFLLNENPACFHRSFYPDADAVYVTHRGEICKTLTDLGCKIVENSEEMNKYTAEKRLLYIEAIMNK